MNTRVFMATAVVGLLSSATAVPLFGGGSSSPRVDPVTDGSGDSDPSLSTPGPIVRTNGYQCPDGTQIWPINSAECSQAWGQNILMPWDVQVSCEQAACNTYCRDSDGSFTVVFGTASQRWCAPESHTVQCRSFDMAAIARDVYYKTCHVPGETTAPGDVPDTTTTTTPEPSTTMATPPDPTTVPSPTDTTSTDTPVVIDQPGGLPEYSWAFGGGSPNGDRVEWKVSIPPQFMSAPNAARYCDWLGNGYHLFSRAPGSATTARPYTYLTTAEQANNVVFIRALGNWLNNAGGNAANGGIDCCCGPTIPECYTRDMLYKSGDSQIYTTRVHWIMAKQQCGTNPTTEAVLDTLNNGNWNATKPHMLGKAEGYAHDDRVDPGTAPHPFICIREVPYSLPDAPLPCTTDDATTMVTSPSTSDATTPVEPTTTQPAVTTEKTTLGTDSTKETTASPQVTTVELDVTTNPTTSSSVSCGALNPRVLDGPQNCKVYVVGESVLTMGVRPSPATGRKLHSLTTHASNRNNCFSQIGYGSANCCKYCPHLPQGTSFLDQIFYDGSIDRVSSEYCCKMGNSCSQGECPDTTLSSSTSTVEPSSSSPEAAGRSSSSTSTEASTSSSTSEPSSSTPELDGSSSISTSTEVVTSSSTTSTPDDYDDYPGESSSSSTSTEHVPTGSGSSTPEYGGRSSSTSTIDPATGSSRSSSSTSTSTPEADFATCALLPTDSDCNSEFGNSHSNACRRCRNENGARPFSKRCARQCCEECGIVVEQPPSPPPPTARPTARPTQVPSTAQCAEFYLAPGCVARFAAIDNVCALCDGSDVDKAADTASFAQQCGRMCCERCWSKTTTLPPTANPSAAPTTTPTSPIETTPRPTTRVVETTTVEQTTPVEVTTPAEDATTVDRTTSADPTTAIDDTTTTSAEPTTPDATTPSIEDTTRVERTTPVDPTTPVEETTASERVPPTIVPSSTGFPTFSSECAALSNSGPCNGEFANSAANACNRCRSDGGARPFGIRCARSCCEHCGTAAPIGAPSISPTLTPTLEPTLAPTVSPTQSPSILNNGYVFPCCGAPIEVTEDTPVGTQIFVVAAEPGSPNIRPRDFTYEIELLDVDARIRRVAADPPFALQADNGTVTLARELDFEEQASWPFEIRAIAADSGAVMARINAEVDVLAVVCETGTFSATGTAPCATGQTCTGGLIELEPPTTTTDRVCGAAPDAGASGSSESSASSGSSSASMAAGVSVLLVVLIAVLVLAVIYRQRQQREKAEVPMAATMARQAQSPTFVVGTAFDTLGGTANVRYVRGAGDEPPLPSPRKHAWDSAPPPAAPRISNAYAEPDEYTSIDGEESEYMAPSVAGGPNAYNMLSPGRRSQQQPVDYAEADEFAEPCPTYDLGQSPVYGFSDPVYDHGQAADYREVVGANPQYELGNVEVQLRPNAGDRSTKLTVTRSSTYNTATALEYFGHNEASTDGPDYDLGGADQRGSGLGTAAISETYDNCAGNRVSTYNQLEFYNAGRSGSSRQFAPTYDIGATFGGEEPQYDMGDAAGGACTQSGGRVKRNSVLLTGPIDITAEGEA
eukprot:m.323857 g.323857  ORF g.323857 m.323857 type:complete len:1571 (+) comp16457_c5_seq9:237-4949(+)